MDQRLPVWTALSELFLDTELTEQDICSIADTLRASPYSRDEIEVILREEVAPAFWTNLLSVAGEWTPWTEGEVRAIMQASLAGRGWSARLWRRVRPRMIPAEWHRVAALLS